MLELEERKIAEFFKDKRVLILGSAPNVIEATPEIMWPYDIIVRVNNYKQHNDYNRTDVFYTYGGLDIKKESPELIKDGVNFLFLKCPKQELNQGEKLGRWVDGKWFYFNCWNKYQGFPCFVQTESNFQDNFSFLGRILTSGISAVLDILRYRPKKIMLAGFDFFASKIHNLDVPWIEARGGGHDNHGEKILIRELIKHNKTVQCMPAIMEVLHG